MASGRREKAQPFSIRLTGTEKAVLRGKAGTVPLGRFVRDVLLADNAQSRIVARPPAHDGATLARVLAMLGQSGIAASLSDLARQAASGTLHVDDEVKARLLQAVDAVGAMRDLLMQALGKKIAEPSIAQSDDVSSAFAHAAWRDGDR